MKKFDILAVLGIIAIIIGIFLVTHMYYQDKYEKAVDSSLNPEIIDFEYMVYSEGNLTTNKSLSLYYNSAMCLVGKYENKDMIFNISKAFNRIRWGEAVCIRRR